MIGCTVSVQTWRTGSRNSSWRRGGDTPSSARPAATPEADAVRPPAVPPLNAVRGLGRIRGEVTFMPMPVRRIDETRGARFAGGRGPFRGRGRAANRERPWPRGARTALPRARLVAGRAARGALPPLRSGAAGRARRAALTTGGGVSAAPSSGEKPGGSARSSPGMGSGRGTSSSSSCRIGSSPWWRCSPRSDTARFPANLPIRTDEDALRHAAALCEDPRAHHRRTARPDRDRGALPRRRGGLSRPAGGGGRRRGRDPALADTGLGSGGGEPRQPPEPRPRPWSDIGTDIGTRDRGRDPACARPPKGLDHLMFTSSTTGPAKAVMHTGDTLAALNVTFAERFGLGDDTPIFMPSPLGHSVGVIHGARLALHNGAPLVLQDQWDPARALDTVAARGCRFTAAATPFLKDLVDSPWPIRGARHPAAVRRAPKLAPLAWFLCGGAQVPPSLMEQAEAELPNTRTTVLWGMTEGGLTTCTAASPPEKVRNTRRGRAPRARAPHPRRARRAVRPGRRGRARDAGAGGVRRLLCPGIPLRIAADPGRVLPHRRPRPHRRRRVRQDHRPGEGPHHPGRGEPLTGPPGGRPRRLPRHARGGGGGLSGRTPRRTGLRGVADEGRRAGGSRGDHLVPARTGGFRNTSGRRSSGPWTISRGRRPERSGSPFSGTGSSRPTGPERRLARPPGPIGPAAAHGESTPHRGTWAGCAPEDDPG